MKPRSSLSCRCPSRAHRFRHRHLPPHSRHPPPRFLLPHPRFARHRAGFSEKRFYSCHHHEEGGDELFAVSQPQKAQSAPYEAEAEDCRSEMKAEKQREARTAATAAEAGLAGEKPKGVRREKRVLAEALAEDGWKRNLAVEKAGGRAGSGEGRGGYPDEPLGYGTRWLFREKKK